MNRTASIAASVLAAALAAGCNQAQEDRAARQAANAVHEGNQALRELTAKGKEGIDKAATAAREAGKEAAPVLTDAAITAKVKTALLADKDVSGMAIDVDTHAGVVTLSGHVDDAQAKRAVDIARAVDGVKSVENRLGAPPKAG